MRLLPLIGITGCFQPPPTIEFGDPARLGPLELDNLAPEVPAIDGDPFPEAMTLVSGHDEESERTWAHLRGWVQADSAEVWFALRELDVMVDRRAVDAWSLREENAHPEFDFSYVIAHTVNDVFTVNYDLTWVHELQEGDVARPERVIARWDKTDGTNFITQLSGSVMLRRVDSGLTEIQLQEHLVAARDDPEIIEAALTDLYTDVVAASHGIPLEAY